MDMFRPIRQKRKASNWVFFAAALARGRCGVNLLYILLGGGVIGAVISVMGGQRHVA